jgi:hypothetical protein
VAVWRDWAGRARVSGPVGHESSENLVIFNGARSFSSPMGKISESKIFGRSNRKER